jgi:DNA-binding NarL/FixJ family response regulator
MTAALANGPAPFTMAAPGQEPLIDSAGWDALQSALGLSRREIEVAQHVFACEKMSTTAQRLHLSLGTVKTYMQRIYAKLNVDDQRSLLLTILCTHRRLLHERAMAAERTPVTTV